MLLHNLLLLYKSNQYICLIVVYTIHTELFYRVFYYLFGSCSIGNRYYPSNSVTRLI